MNIFDKTYNLSGREMKYRKNLNWEYRRSANELMHLYEQLELEYTEKTKPKFVARSAEFLELAERAAAAKNKIEDASDDQTRQNAREDFNTKNEVFRSAVTSDFDKAIEYQSAFADYQRDKERAKMSFIYDPDKFGLLIKSCIEDSGKIDVKDLYDLEGFEEFANELLADFFLNANDSLRSSTSST